MMNKAISFTFWCMLIPFSKCQFCQIRISRNEIKDLCCADYEKRENDCVGCSKGYTSDMGQNCKSCPKNNYGERCLFECSCQDFEVCDNVEGCVQASSTTDSSMYSTSETFIQPVSDKTCIAINESGEIKKVCCADFEEIGSDCHACLKGFMSDAGQNCRPCSNSTYGERCLFDCSCTDTEMCDHVEGCVLSPSTSGNSVDHTSDTTILPWYLDVQTKGQNTDDSKEAIFLLPREIITYVTLPLSVVVLGICVCFTIYKYKIACKMKKVTIIHPRHTSLHQQRQYIEMEERLYETIGDTNMLRYVQQMLKETPSSNGEIQIV